MASFNIASEQAGDAVFTVFPSGSPSVGDSVPLNTDGFATSADSTDPRRRCQTGPVSPWRRPAVPLFERSTLVIDVTQSNILMRVASLNPDANLIAVLVVDTGRTTQMTYVPAVGAGQ